MIALAIIQGLVLFVIFIAMAATWFGKSSDIKDCSRFAAVLAGVVVLASLPLVMTTGALAFYLAVAFVIGIVRIFLFTAVGTYCCAAAGFAAFPLLKPGLGGLDERSARLAIRPAMVVALLAAGAWCVYTMVLFHMVTPELSEAAKLLLGEAEEGNGPGLALALLGVSAVALEEELIYRLGIQNFVARVFDWWDRRYWLAILVSATIWTIGHIGMVEPGWVKLAQIFPAGLALGWLARKHGIEACIVAHVGFNVAAFWMGETGLIPV